MNNEIIREKIEFEKEWMERDIKSVENRNPPKPDDPSFGRALVVGLKVFGVALVIAVINFLLVLATDGSYLFIVITSCAIVFGAILAISCAYSEYSHQCKVLEEWEDETNSYRKQVEIDRIKRKYNARISNLEKYGTVKGEYSYWHHPPKVCLQCGSTNVELDTWQDSYRLHREANLICKDCGWKEFYW